MKISGRGSWSSLWAATVMLGAGQVALAEPITFAAKAEVYFVSWPLTDLGFAVGDEIILEYTFDSEAEELYPGTPDSSAYPVDDVALLDDGGGMYTHGGAEVSVLDDWPSTDFVLRDYYLVFGWGSFENVSREEITVYLELGDENLIAFSGTALPLLPPDLSQFELATLQLNVDGLPGSRLSARVTSLELAQCEPLQQALFVDNTGGVAIVTGDIENERSNENGSVVADFTIENSARFWLETIDLRTAENRARLSPAPSLGGFFAGRGLIPPCPAGPGNNFQCAEPGTAAWAVSFCGPDVVTVRTKFTFRASALTTIDILFGALVDAAALVDLAADLEAVPAIADAFECLASPALDARGLRAQFRCVGEALRKLRKNEAQLELVWLILLDHGIELTIGDLVDILLRFPVKSSQILVDLGFLVGQTPIDNTLEIKLEGD